MAITNPKPYETNNPYVRRFKKKNDNNDTEPDSMDSNENSENESESSRPATSNPQPPSSFSKDAIKRRLAKDRYS